AVEAIGSRFPGLPQIACFDTHFHWHLPERARRLPLPESLHAEGVRRYGFHGLSYEFIVSELGRQLGQRAVIAHLGNGTSLAALGGLDTLVLTGGIGENSSEVRAGICAGLEHLGLALDDAANRSARACISAAGSRCAAYLIRTDEDRIIARHARELLRA